MTIDKRDEIPARALTGLVRAAEAAIVAAGQPKLLLGYVGDHFPIGSHSFVTGTIGSFPFYEIEDEDEAAPGYVRPVVLKLAVGRLRQAEFESMPNCTPKSWIGSMPTCAEPLPQLPADDDCDALDVDDRKIPSVVSAAVQAIVDREAILRRIRALWCEQLDACEVKGGKTLRLTSYEPFEEGRFIGSRIEWTARLG